jgi:hypothetical protein
MPMAVASPDADAARDFGAGCVADDTAHNQADRTGDDCADNATYRGSPEPGVVMRLCSDRRERDGNGDRDQSS